ncbi:hypothetical protein BDF19DRAFT_111092 [Syncephalis fuscata]|nr:hypothetical protein BDF19DRAFT_111092 [Syncephalis fuscata]
MSRPGPSLEYFAHRQKQRSESKFCVWPSSPEVRPDDSFSESEDDRRGRKQVSSHKRRDKRSVGKREDESVSRSRSPRSRRSERSSRREKDRKQHKKSKKSKDRRSERRRHRSPSISGSDSRSDSNSDTDTRNTRKETSKSSHNTVTSPEASMSTKDVIMTDASAIDHDDMWVEKKGK